MRSIASVVSAAAGDPMLSVAYLPSGSLASVGVDWSPKLLKRSGFRPAGAVRLRPARRAVGVSRPHQRGATADARPQGGGHRARGQQPAAADAGAGGAVSHACFIPEPGNESGSVSDMTNVRKLTRVVTAS